MEYTDNSLKYNFKDFTRTAYRSYLKIAKDKYPFRTFLNFNKSERYILWRHDIDLSMHAAFQIAQIEAEEGVIANYFVHLHNPFYNFFDSENFQLLKKIAGLGHLIGLHFDSHFYGIETEDKLDEHLSFEKSILQKALGVEINVFSFHNTTPFTMACQKWEYAGMINTYASYFRENVGYCSDSNGIWRFRRLEDVLLEAKEPQLQILTHPEMWQESVMSPRQRIHRCIDGRAEKNKYNYDKDLGDFGRENIDW
jgi:hypothetical protein